MKRKLLILFIAMLAVLVCLAACAKPEEEVDDSTAEVTITSIEVVKDSTPAQVNLDATPDFSGIQVKVNYSNGTSETVGFDKVTVGAVDTSEVGKKIVTVTYQTATTTFEIYVVDPEATAYVIGIDANMPAENAQCYVYDEFKLDALQVTATYSTGRVEVLAKDQYTCSTIDTSVVGEQTLTVVYNADNSMTDTVKVTVIGVKDIVVVKDTVATKIKIGQTYVTTGIQVLVTYTNDVTDDKEYKDLTVGTIDTTTAGVKQLTVTYKDKTINFAVEVIAPDYIEINKGSYPEEINVGTAYTAPELEGWLYYTDGVTKEKLSAADVTCTVDTTAVGTKQLVFTHAGLSTQPVNVEVIGVESMSVVDMTGTLKNEILKGEQFDESAIAVNVTYTNNKTAVVYASDLQISGTINENQAGEQKLTIAYLNASLEYTVKVCQIVAIEATMENTVVQSGDDIDENDVVVYGVYDDSKGSKTKDPLTGFTTNAAELNADKTNENNKTLVVTWGTFTDTIVITTTPPDLVRIDITAYDKYVEIGGDYNERSVVVYAYYDNTNRKPISFEKLNVTDVVTTAAGNVELKVTYTENNITAEKIVTVKVLPITNVAVSGIANKVNKGEQLDTAGVIAVVTFSDGVDTITRRIVGNALTVAQPANGTVGNETLTVTYLGVPGTHSYYVRGIQTIAFFDAEFNTKRENYAVDFDNIMVDIIYTNSDREQKRLADIKGFTATVESEPYPNRWNDDDEVTGYGVKVTLTHEDAGTIERELDVIKLQYIHAITGSIPPSIFQGDTLDLSNMKVAFVYDNGDTYLISVKDNSAITYTNIDPTKSGEQHIDITYVENGKTFTTVVIVNVKGVSTVEIVPGTVRTVIYSGSDKFDISRLLVKVTYTDGTYVYVRLDDENTKLRVESLPSSAVVGENKTKFVVSYMDVKGEILITVKDRVEAPGNTGFIFGTLKPDELVERESYIKTFQGATAPGYVASPYMVGDDNKYYFYLNVVMLDANYNIIETNGSTERTAVKISMNGTPLDDYTPYVTFNPADNSYDFTEAAIGNTFTLEVRPENSDRYDPANADIVKTHTVKVVDGYNVYHAWELNVMTNSTRDITSECFGSAGSITQVDVVDRYLATKGIQRPDKVASIVLHNNLDVTPKDVPSEYFCKDANGEIQGIYDHLGLFHRYLRPEEKSFSIYGNYYTVTSYQIPCVTPKGVANNDDDYSSSQLFMVRPSTDAHDDIRDRTDDFKNYTVNIQDIATRDDDPNSNDQSASARHMRGLICYKLGEMNINMTNVNTDAYMTSVVAENMGTTLNLTKVKFYNSWQGHLFLWSYNEHQEDYGGKNEATWDYIPNLVVNINDSSLTKSGGPVILAQTPHPDYVSERNCGVEVYANNSDINTYVTGQEAWFVAVGQTQVATTVLTMGQLVSKTINPANGQPIGIPEGHGFVTTTKISGVPTTNMMMVAMGNDGTSLSGLTPNALFKMDGVTVMQSHNPAVGGKDKFATPVFDQVNAGILQNTGGVQPPVFQTSGGGIAFTDTRAMYAAYGDFSAGDYITLYYKDLGANIAMEYYHP